MRAGELTMKKVENGIESEAQGTASEAQGTASKTQGTASETQGTASERNTASEAQGVEQTTKKRTVKTGEGRTHSVPKATIGRLPLYLRFLQEARERGETHISSSVIAQHMSVSSVLVRKDLEAIFPERGTPRKGFHILRLIAAIEKYLGYDNLSDVVIVGAGGLGQAFLGYEGFKNNGLNIVAAFDCDERLIGKYVADKPILSIDEFDGFVKKYNIRIGVIAVPKAAAQEILDKMVAAGIKAIWNFAPVALVVPKDVAIKTEDLSASLSILAGRLFRLRENQ